MGSISHHPRPPKNDAILGYRYLRKWLRSSRFEVYRCQTHVVIKELKTCYK